MIYFPILNVYISLQILTFRDEDEHKNDCLDTTERKFRILYNKLVEHDCVVLLQTFPLD